MERLEILKTYNERSNHFIIKLNFFQSKLNNIHLSKNDTNNNYQQINLSFKRIHF